MSGSNKTANELSSCGQSDSKTATNNLWTPANIVTIIRILGVPIFVIALLSPWPSWFPQVPALESAKPWVAVGLFIVLACTDSVDGYLARSRGEVTTFGKFMDPLADKILVFAALLAMIELGFIPCWVALVILIREFIVSGLRMIAATSGEVIAASWYGKAKTVLQIIAIILFLLKGICLPSWNSPSHLMYIVSWVAMGIALVLTIVSLIDYFVKCMPMLGFSKVKSEKCKSENSPKISSVEFDDSDIRCYEMGDIDIVKLSDLNSMAYSVVEKFSICGLSLCTAESLTGGMICELLTSVPGSSAVVRGGEVTYAIDTKANILGVSAGLLEREGAVDANVAAQMAHGALALNDADYCVSVTGIAGPGGAEAGKPVGTVYMGIANKSRCATFRFNFAGSRDEVRAKTCMAAFQQLLEFAELS